MPTCYILQFVKSGAIQKSRLGDQARDLLRRGLWGLPDDSPAASKLEAGDRVLVFAGAPERAFVGDAVVDRPWHAYDQQELADFPQPANFTGGISLRDASIWNAELPLSDVWPSLDASVSNPHAHFMSSTYELSDSDAEAILGASAGDRPTPPKGDSVDRSALGDPELSWNGAIELCRGFLADRAEFDREERDYKLVVAERVTALLEAAENDGPLFEAATRVMASPNNLLAWRAAAAVKQWLTSDGADVRDALVALTREADGPAAIDAFLQRFPREVVSGLGGRVAVASMLLMGRDPEHFPIVRAQAFGRVEKVLHRRLGPDVSEPAAAYQHHLDFLDELTARLRSADVDVRDALDAQSLVWMLHWKPEAAAWRGETESEPDDLTTSGVPKRDHLEAGSVEELAASLYVDEDYVQEILGLLRRKRQLIFYGPPGTGKTYIARAIAHHVSAEAADGLEIVQFHPSYSYEDFVLGYRPTLTPERQMVYELKAGPLLQLARRAQQERSRTFVLLIDEINRGNLPRIFGELLYLLEYRDEAVNLMYADDDEERFKLPDNLWFIGTMNTADRSIGLIDAAVRRRFHFVAVFPNTPPIDQTLRRWLAANNPGMAHVADILDRLNERLRERFGPHLQIGHSYFMDPQLDEELLEQIWAADIQPLLEDQLFGQESELSALSLAKLQHPVVEAPVSSDPTAEDADEDDPASGIQDAD